MKIIYYGLNIRDTCLNDALLSKNKGIPQNIHLSLSLSQKNYVTQEVQFYNRQIEIGHL